MNFKLKRGVAVLVPVMGLAVAGAVGAQVISPESAATSPVLTSEQHSILLGQTAFAPDGTPLGTVIQVLPDPISASNGIAIVQNDFGQTIQVPVDANGDVIAETLPLATDTSTLIAVQPAVSAEPPLIVAQASAPSYAPPVRMEPTVVELQLPRGVSPRSGQGDALEIATRWAPVDARAGLSPDYLLDQSPGM